MAQLTSIHNAVCSCECGWLGTVDDCEPDVDGEGSLGCPGCNRVVLTGGSTESPGGWQFLIHWYARHKYRLHLPPELTSVVEGYLDSIDGYRAPVTD